MNQVLMSGKFPMVNATPLPPVTIEVLWQILHEAIDDATVNQLLWQALGYRYDAEGDRWDSTHCIGDWGESYPHPPDFIGERPPTVKLTRSIPGDQKQLLKEYLGFQGYRIGEFGPRQTRRATAVSWFLSYLKAQNQLPEVAPPPPENQKPHIGPETRFV